MTDPNTTESSRMLADPGAQAIARTYARAFLGAAGDAAAAGLDEFGEFVDVAVLGHPEFRQLLDSGIVSREEKLGIIERTVAGRASELFANFLRVLTRHDRLDLLPLIRAEAQRQHEESTGHRRVIIRTARALTDETRNSTTARLRDTFGFEPILEEQIDEALLGGIIIQVDDTVYDSSLRTRLKQLRGSLRERALNEIQSGRDRFSNPEGN